MPDVVHKAVAVSLSYHCPSDHGWHHGTRRHPFVGCDSIRNHPNFPTNHFMLYTGLRQCLFALFKLHQADVVHKAAVALSVS